MSKPKSEFTGEALSRSKRFQLLGLNSDDLIRYFFGGNAFVAMVILGLITLFLFKEGAGFFGQYREDIEVYQRGGMQYVDIIGEQTGDLIALKQFYDSIRDAQIKQMADAGVEFSEIQQRLANEFAFASELAAAGRPLEGVLSRMRNVGIETKELYARNQANLQRRDDQLRAGNEELAANVKIIEFSEDFWRERFQPIQELVPEYQAIITEMEQNLKSLEERVPEPYHAEYKKQTKRFSELLHRFVDHFPDYEEKLQEWKQFEPVPYHRAVVAFLFGTRWLTGTAWHEFYGIIPLFTGSLMIALIAIGIAVPFSVGAAIYVNQIAGKKEQSLIKPYIEFIGALPSVVLGFFGVIVLGGALQELFGLEHRLNAFVAGVLLALMAVPTIFTLTEDALNNVPRSFREASLAMGATSLQTTLRVIVPTALSAIISAILLGFGRVIGETMVVLLVAGNRIEIPDLGMGPAVIFEPVHTMTGIIAQELPEVVNGSIHYRALFMVGVVLFFIALFINFIAQKIVRRFKLSAG